MTMLDDRDHRPDATNERLAALLELERDRPERVAAAIGFLAFVIVACGAALVSWAVLGW